MLVERNEWVGKSDTYMDRVRRKAMREIRNSGWMECIM